MRPFKRKRVILTLVLCALILGACGSEKKEHAQAPVSGETEQDRDAGSEPGTGEERVADAETGKDEGKNADVEPGTSEEMGAKGLSLCGSYFKRGDYRYQMEIEPGGQDEPGMLLLTFRKREAPYSSYFMPSHQFHISSHDAAGTVTGKDVSSDSKGSEFGIIWEEDKAVTLKGETEAAGTYYPEKGNLIMPEAFSRPLNDTDLIDLSQEQLKLIRNQFYAVYGREFKSEDLKNYFEALPWYEGRIGAKDFDEGIMEGLERRNVTFLKHAEENYDETRAKDVRTAYEALAPAPYVSLLPGRGEIYVEMDSDAGHTADRGIYYEAQGSIAVPITITMEQYEAVEEGQEVELSCDDITGETLALKKAKLAQYGDYVLVDPKDRDETAGRFVYLAFEPYARTFRMWENSEDTVFKRVYEGTIYVLKGACEEYVYYFNLPGGERGQGAGAYRVMDFNESGPYGPAPYQGNVLVTDSKGYMKALYFRGD